MGYLIGSIWVLIPITAILVGAFEQWLKFRAEQKKLGTATTDLEATVATLQAEREKMLKRIENLEAIVTSRTWSVLREDDLASTNGRAAAVASVEFQAPPRDPEPRHEAAELARRLRA